MTPILEDVKASNKKNINDNCIQQRNLEPNIRNDSMVSKISCSFMKMETDKRIEFDDVSIIISPSANVSISKPDGKDNNDLFNRSESEGSKMSLKRYIVQNFKENSHC